ncbi:OmpW/AlkL family protein [Ensifer soli]|uniref:OmpW/AlkL family protein n=1 Tax=Ciceribacter sp. sgz301302 TaxID=3342379 RepID=UPI0035B76C22
MKYGSIVTLLAATCALVATSAHAEDDKRWFLKSGPAVLILNEGAEVKAGGAKVPGGTISIDNHYTAAFELGYFLTDNIAVSFTGGFPPTVDINGAGTLSPTGKLGAVTYGPTALTAQYHFDEIGRFRPYIGGGPMFMFVFDNKDGALNKLKVDPAIGATVQAGVDMKITDDWGLFVDVKKAYLRTDSSGSLGGAPVKADVRLDPLVISAGVSLKF